METCDNPSAQRATEAAVAQMRAAEQTGSEDERTLTLEHVENPLTHIRQCPCLEAVVVGFLGVGVWPLLPFGVTVVIIVPFGVIPNSWVVRFLFIKTPPTLIIRHVPDEAQRAHLKRHQILNLPGQLGDLGC